MNNENINDKVNESVLEERIVENKLEQLHKRYNWIDQARGLTVFFLLIAGITWVLQGDSTLNIPPVGPPWLNHGFEYFEITGAPIITIIDLGAALFVFLLGISIPISFRSKLKKMGLKYAWVKAGTRFFVLLAVNTLLNGRFALDLTGIIGLILLLVGIGISIYFGMIIKKDSDDKAYFGLLASIISLFSLFMLGIGDGLTVWDALLGDTLGHLAWAGLIGTFAVYLFDNPNKRQFLAYGLLGLHFVLWMFIGFREKLINGTGTVWDGLRIPYDPIAFGAIAIISTCVWDWLDVKKDGGKEGSRIVIKYALIILMVSVVFDFIQPADHHGTNLALSLLAVGTGCSFVIIFIALENYYDYKIPYLTSLGRNALLAFALTTPYMEIYGGMWDGKAINFWAQYPGILGGLMGIVFLIIPIVIIMSLMVFLDKKKLYLKL